MNQSAESSVKKNTFGDYVIVGVLTIGWFGFLTVVFTLLGG